MPSKCEKCTYSEFFWSVFFRIWTEYGKLFRISLYSVQMRKNIDQENSEYGHFSRSLSFQNWLKAFAFTKQISSFARECLFKGLYHFCQKIKPQ